MGLADTTQLIHASRLITQLGIVAGHSEFRQMVRKGPAPRAPNRPSYRPNAPLSGANATPVNQGAPRQAAAKPVNVVNMGGNSENLGPSQQGGYPGNSYREAHQSYVVFVSEPNNKKSELRRAKEVNAVIPAIPKYLN